MPLRAARRPASACSRPARWVRRWHASTGEFDVDVCVLPSASRSERFQSARTPVRRATGCLCAGNRDGPHSVRYHADDRFAYASTYKALIAGVLLRRDSDADLNHVITYSAADLQKYAPITSQ